MHRLVTSVGLAGALAAALAREARADDPRDLFGLTKPPVAAPLDCADGRAFGCARATDALADGPTPYALSTWLPARELLALPVADATHDAVAGYALGAATDGAGVAAGGATGAENRWTLDGAPIDGVRTGVADLRIPLLFLDGIRVTVGGFGARDRASTGGVIDAQLRRGGATHVVEAAAWLGVQAPGTTAPTPAGAFAIRSATLDVGPTATAAVVATGPLGHVAGGAAWYAAGVAPSLALDHVTWRSHRLVDTNGDDVPDGAPGVLTTVGIDTTRASTTPISVPAFARVGWDRGVHALDLTLIGQGARSTRYLGNATLSAAGVDATNVTLDGVATYRGRWPDTHVTVQLAWHRATHSEAATDPAAAAAPQHLDAYLPAGLADPALVAGCAIGATAKFAPCPVPTGFFASGGAGLLTDSTADRPTVTAEIAHRAGAHTVRAGVTDEDSRLDTTQRFTGGQQIRSLFAGDTAVIRFVDPSQPCPNDATQPCTYTDAARLTYRTRYTAGFVEDTWQLAPRLVVDGGLRWEMDQVGSALAFRAEPAPRLGLAWDPLGGGRSRVWTSMGRTYPLLVAGMGAQILGTAATADDQTSPFGVGRTVDLGGPHPVAAGIQPTVQDELTAGAQVAAADLARLTAWVTARYLRQGFDTTFGRFDNPGRLDPAVPEARRDSQVWALEVATAPTSPLALRAGYTYTQVLGTWTGAYDPRQGVVLFGGADYDQDARDLYGRLPTDGAHRAYIEAARSGHLAGLEVGVSTRLTIASGRPLGVLGNSDEGVIELLPRGSAGRLPMTSQANVRLRARWRGTEVTLDLFNLFDRQDPTSAGEIYAGGQQSVRPIQGGAPADLVWLRTVDGLVPDREPSFRLPSAFQAPFAAVLGARRVF